MPDLMPMIPKMLVIDVDGVMTTGQFFYSVEGKMYKVFGPDDSDGLQLVRDRLDVIFVSADHRGFPISRKRIVDDMGYRLELISTADRINWMREHADLAETIYIGDGFYDYHIFDAVGYGICPADGFYLTREHADFVTRSGGGNRAVAEACVHILETFFPPFDPDEIAIRKFAHYEQEKYAASQSQ
jgi:3-deoxy-D-manno-octulosonate 8-phosphate phosphatase (KDO 8-P phosphatase)